MKQSPHIYQIHSSNSEYMPGIADQYSSIKMSVQGTSTAQSGFLPVSHHPSYTASEQCNPNTYTSSTRETLYSYSGNSSWEDMSSHSKHSDEKSLSSKFQQVLFSIKELRFLNWKTIKNNRTELAGWFALFLLIIVGYKFFSDGSFSAILTLASAFQCFSLFVLNQKVVSQQSITGISQRTVALIVICLLMRLSSTLFYNGYLPVDRTGDWLYQGADILSVLLGGCLLFYSYQKNLSSNVVQEDKDTAYVVIPIGIALVLGIIIHPTLNQNFISDTAWSFALYLETYSMVPQLFMMGKLGGEVEALTSHYVASMAASKICNFLFWYFSYTELRSARNAYNFAGWAVLAAYSIQALLYVDFLYYYVKSLRVGQRMIINF